MTQSDERGVTLIETMVVLAIMTTIMLLLSQVFILNYDVYVKQVARIEASTNTTLAARSVSELARGAIAVVDTATINSTSYTTGPDELVLQLPSIDASDEILPETFDYIAIYRDDTDPTRIMSDTEVGGASVRPSGTRVVTRFNEYFGLRFNAADVTLADRISIHLRNSTTVRGATHTSRAWTTIFLRNN